MGDLFDEPSRVFYCPKFDNLLILNPANLTYLATLEGSSGRKLMVDPETAIAEGELVEIGDL